MCLDLSSAQARRAAVEGLLYPELHVSVDRPNEHPFALGFVFIFTVGGSNAVLLANASLDVAFHDRYLRYMLEPMSSVYHLLFTSVRTRARRTWLLSSGWKRWVVSSDEEGNQ